jgi:hypothetical protein
MWEPLRLRTLWASTACYRESFIFFFFFVYLYLTSCYFSFIATSSCISTCASLHSSVSLQLIIGMTCNWENKKMIVSLLKAACLKKCRLSLEESKLLLTSTSTMYVVRTHSKLPFTIKFELSVNTCYKILHALSYLRYILHFIHCFGSLVA